MKLDRALQKKILEVLGSVYPEPLGARIYLLGDPDKVLLRANLAYLGELGLVESILPAAEQRAHVPRINATKITAKGLDFLEQDGGLSAILGTVTVKLHADTIRDLLETRIMESQLPATEKKRFVDQLKELPGEALKTLTNKLIEKACDNPEAVVSVFNSIF